MKKTIKSALSILLCCVILLAFAACKKTDAPATTTPPAGGATATPEAPSGGGDAPPAEPPAASARDTITIAVNNDNGSMDPIDLGGGSMYKDVSRMINEPLFDIDANGDIVWILATGYEEVTPVQWIVHVREGVKFSNGNPFTAEDVYFTLKRNNTHETWAPSIPVLGDLSASRVIDDYTLELNFDSYDLSVKNNMPTIQMYDAETYDPEDMKVNPIGTGPYLLDTYVINSHVTLKRNPDYWGTPGKSEFLKFRCINESSQVVNSLEVGMVDIATVSSQDVSYVQGLSGFKTLLRSMGSSQAVWFNTSVNSIFNSREARQAVAYCIDRQSIVNLVYFGLATIPDWPLPTTTTEYSAELAGADPTYQNVPDLEKAKQLAESSGLTKQTVVIATNGVAEVITMSEILQAALSQIGVDAKIISYDTATAFAAYSDTAGGYDIFFSGLYVPSNSAAQHYFGWYTYMPCLNEGTWEGKERFAELAAGIMGVTDEQQRYKNVVEMTNIFAREVGWYNLVEPQSATAYAAELAPSAFMLAGNTYYSDWAWVS